MTAMLADSSITERFTQKVTTDLSGALVTALVALGDRLGLLNALATGGPLTSRELSTRTAIHERYAREWLRGMVAGGYVLHDADTRQFTLPLEHAAVVADNGHADSLVGMSQLIIGLMRALDPVAAAFRDGRAVPCAAYDRDVWDGLDRLSAAWTGSRLLQQWLPAMPSVLAALERGVDVADVGCARDGALVRLAEAFPACRFVGYVTARHPDASAVPRASHSKVVSRIQWVDFDVSVRPASRFDVILTFHSLHTAPHPVEMLRWIHDALDAGGTYLCIEANGCERLTDNRGAVGALLYGLSVMHELSLSLADDGVGLGTLDLHERRLREYATVIGFRHVDVVARDALNALFELRL